MKKLKLICMLLLLLSSSIIMYAQDGTKKTGVGELMRSNGRIYVVVAVMLTILLGLILYLVRLDRKIGNLENDNRQ